jgi:hypothetical protein
MRLHSKEEPAKVLWRCFTLQSPTKIATTVRSGLRTIENHTGIPALVVAAIVLVLGYRVLRNSARIFFQVALLALMLAAATRAGWIRW